MTDALIEIPSDETAVTTTNDVFNAVTKSGNYLPRIQLMTSNSSKCKAGEFPVNHFALVVDQDFVDLGESIDLLVIDWRPKAIEMGDEVMSVFDVEDPEFKRIQSLAGEKDSGCMFGPEYLVYEPTQGVFATFFMGSASLRREARAMNTRLRKLATLVPVKISTRKYTWFTPKVGDCSTPFEIPGDSEIRPVWEAFKNPAKPTVERAPEGAGGRER
jgi:hypothetical protein